MENNKKTLAVIGGGVAGNLSAKYAIESGFKVALFDKNGEIGGNWRKGDSNIWPEMQANLTKFTMQLSDFALSDLDEIYPYKASINFFLLKYIEAFGVDKCIKYNTQI